MKSHVSSGLCSYFLGSQFAFKRPLLQHIHIFARLSHIRQCGQSACRITAKMSVTCSRAPPGNLRQERKITGETRTFQAPLLHRAALLIERPCSYQLLCRNRPQHREPLKQVPKWPRVTTRRLGLWMGAHHLERIIPVQ